MERDGRNVIGVKSVFVTGIFVMLAAAAWVMIRESRESSGRLPCPTNLRDIGMAILQYANSHGGRCPPSLKELKESGGLSQEKLICPDDRAKHADGESTYIYLCAGKNFKDIKADDVMAYEPLAIKQEGGNVLFGDGHVEFIEARVYKEVEQGSYHPGPTSQSN